MWCLKGNKNWDNKFSDVNVHSNFAAKRGIVSDISIFLQYFQFNQTPCCKYCRV